MKVYLFLLCLIFSTLANADPEYKFGNKDQQVEIQKSVYDLVIKHNSKNCKIVTKVITDYEYFPVTSRKIYVELFIKNKSLIYPELELSNWSKFKYDFNNLIIDICEK